MQARMNNPVMIVPDALHGFLAASKAARKQGLAAKTAHLVHLRASQINGCTVCVDMHAKEAKAAGESDERLWAVAAWSDSPLFSDAERAALALTEAATRIADRSDAVSEDVWLNAKRHYDEPQLAALVLEIALINAWNRINVTTRQVPGPLPK